MQNTAYIFERVKIESLKIRNFSSSLVFSEVILISFVMLNNNKNVICNKKCTKFTLDQTPDSMTTMANTSIGGSAPDVCL